MLKEWRSSPNGLIPVFLDKPSAETEHDELMLRSKGFMKITSAVQEAGKGSSVNTLRLAYPWRILLVGVGLILVVGALAASLGSVSIPPSTVLKIIASKVPFIDVDQSWPNSWDTILWKLRFPRIVLAGLVGAALAVSGATYQGLFRNPLASPSLIGASSGAGLGATVVLVTGVPHYFYGISTLPVAAFLGGVSVVMIACLVAQQSSRLSLTRLILAGVALSFFTGAITSLLMIRSDPDLRPVLGWLLGSFASSQWKHSLIVTLYLVPSLLLVMMYGRILNIFQLDEEQAFQLGVNVQRTKILLIIAATLATATAVSFSGPILFVGLIAPHAVRLVWGIEYRFLLPMSGIVGAGFLILADLVARTVVSPTELPVGIITAFCGAPFFIYLLRWRQGRTDGIATTK